MATQKEIRRRIRTVEKTQQITSAMRMVSAAKLRRAQDAILAARPYAQQIWAMMYELGRRQPELSHPLLRQHPEPKRLEVLVIASDLAIGVHAATSGGGSSPAASMRAASWTAVRMRG